MRSYPKAKHICSLRRIFSTKGICGAFFSAHCRKDFTMAKEQTRHTDLHVKERNKLTLNGVCNVASFDESYVTLATTDGRVCIEGEGLKIESLARESGEIEIVGKIDGVFYTEQKKKGKTFSKLFG